MIFDEAHFITVSLSARLRAQDICGGSCGELLRAATVSAKRTLAAHLQLLRGLLRVPSDLICDCFEDYFEYREIPSTIAVSRILLESSPNLATKYSRGIRLYASFTFSRSQITPRV